MQYMTNEKFRVAGFGIDLSVLEDVELSSVLSRATAAVNAYCSVPTLPQPHDFRGGTIIEERHNWNIGSDLIAGTRRFWPWHQPVLDVTAFTIQVTEGSYIEIDPADMFINNSAGWVEIVALTLGVGVFPVVANMSMSTPVGQMSYTYGRQFAEIGERLAETDGQTFRAQNQFWLDDPEPVIYKNGTEITTGFSVDRSEGTVVFDSSLMVGDVVTADYTYTLPSQIAEATGIIAASYLSERNLTAKGMSGLLELQVNEVRLRRPTPTALLAREASTALIVPPDAAIMLAPYVFRGIG